MDETAAEAAAAAAGYRPCLACRPETAPGMSGVDARANLARRATFMIRERCGEGARIEAIAAKPGYTARTASATEGKRRAIACTGLAAPGGAFGDRRRPARDAGKGERT